MFFLKILQYLMPIYVSVIPLLVAPAAIAAPSFTFTDDPLTAQSTSVKAVHITELRQAINTLRTRHGLSTFSFSDPTITGGVTAINAVHVAEMRTALHGVYDALGQTRPTYTDLTITPGTTLIKRAHIEQIRNASKAVDVFTITVNKTGTGSGTVTSTPTGINCGGDCTETFAPNTSVTLAATAATNSTFTGWGGDADCSDGVVTMNSNIACTATFDLLQFTLTVNKAGTGSGTVTSSPPGIDCGSNCSEVHSIGTFVTLTAIPAADSTFEGWSGGSCSGTGSCVVTMNTNITATADFGTAVTNDPVEFTGPFPASANVSYTDTNNQTVIVPAYSGQVIVYFDPLISVASASALIQANGGTVLGQYPAVGFYLVEVTAGQEGAFILDISNDSGVNLAIPHVTTLYMAAGATIIDNCSSGGHGPKVQDAFTEAGGTAASCVDDDDGTGKPSIAMTQFRLFELTYQEGTGTKLINISSHGGSGNGAWPNASPSLKKHFEDGWFVAFTTILEGIAQLDQETRENLVVTICAGNGNMPLTTLMEEIRTDAEITAILKNNVLIVGATDTAYADSNDAPGDPDFALMTDATCGIGVSCEGTSFAAPRALAIVQKVVNNKGLSGTLALKAAKMAIAANANQILDETEVNAKADAILVALGTDLPSAANVTGISFTSIGSTTGALVAPVTSGVTVQYTVSGSDGYFDTGNLQTDSLGQVSFFIPPGAPNVTDRITVSALLSGVSASQSHTW